MSNELNAKNCVVELSQGEKMLERFNKLANNLENTSERVLDRLHMVCEDLVPTPASCEKELSTAQAPYFAQMCELIMRCEQSLSTITDTIQRVRL